MRYFLVDRITSVILGKEAQGIKCVTLTDPILHDHFPTHPIFPGALITEGLAQLAGYLLEVSHNTSESQEIRRAVLAQIEKMKFHEMTRPGDRLIYTAKIESELDDAARVRVEAREGESIRAQGLLTFVLLKIDSQAIHEQRQSIYGIWTQNLPNAPLIR